MPRTCSCGKRCYGSEGWANGERKALMKRHSRRGQNPHALNVYWCDKGHAWHIGHGQILTRVLKG